VLCAPRGLKVIDFGIASATDAASLTRTGLIVGSTGWMAPEQVNGSKVLPLTDVFCWASVVYFAATGRPPFGEGSPAAVLYRVVANEPDLTDPRIEPRMLPLLRAAFAKDPLRRPAAPDLLNYLLPHRETAPAFAAMPSSPPPSSPPPKTPPPGYRPSTPLR
jgi:serine/threonine protein kinase